MSTAQFNMKMDARLKKQAQMLSREFGLNLSDLLRSFVCYFVRGKDVSFLLKNQKEEEVDTVAGLTGSVLAKHLIADGWSSAKAKKFGKAYDDMLRERKEGTLIEL